MATAGCSDSPKLDAEQQHLVTQAKEAGAQSLVATVTDDGGMRLNGTLEGRAFALVIPWRWNRQSVLFANGYAPPGTPVDIKPNPLQDDGVGVARTPYAQGLAVGYSAYDKAGIGVQSGVANLHRLKLFTDKLGGTRAFLVGTSMGGNVAIASIEKYPRDYAGAIAACGVVGGWPIQISWMSDVRVLYNYFTKGTRYELPGERSVRKSALPTLNTGILKYAHGVGLLWQIRRLSNPILDLFAAAKKNPGGPEDKIIDDIAAASGTPKDPAAFAYPIVTAALGQDDIVAVFGGQIYNNVDTVYRSSLLNAAENEALNRGVERVRADPAAVAKADEWYTPNGHFSTKLIAIFNEVDSLVPSDRNERKLKQAVEAAGNGANLIQRPVPAMYDPHVLATDTVGLRHCGFTAPQIVRAVNDMLHWANSGERPQN
jgi:pimeloyl-ACP methyl ester carboxylesterase